MAAGSAAAAADPASSGRVLPPDTIVMIQSKAMTDNPALRLLRAARLMGPVPTTTILDRPTGEALRLARRQTRTGAERPDYQHTAHWVLCDVRLAKGIIVEGAMRLTPPQPGRINPKITRATAIVAHFDGRHVDLVRNGERQRVRLASGDTFPLRVRLAEDPPNPITGLMPGHPDEALPIGAWSRPLNPGDFIQDVLALTPRI